MLVNHSYFSAFGPNSGSQHRTCSRLGGRGTCNRHLQRKHNTAEYLAEARRAFSYSQLSSFTIRIWNLAAGLTRLKSPMLSERKAPSEGEKNSNCNWKFRYFPEIIPKFLGKSVLVLIIIKIKVLNYLNKTPFTSLIYGILINKQNKNIKDRLSLTETS